MCVRVYVRVYMCMHACTCVCVCARIHSMFVCVCVGMGASVYPEIFTALCIFCAQVRIFMDKILKMTWNEASF